ncbi:P-loop containing nucleoside triphosphate hydrolase protein, partial [Meira miltonrushii]
ITSIGQIELPYRKIWKMKQFNRMQSEMVGELLTGDENVVVTAPTGAGKTVLFEMALIRMFQNHKEGKAVYLAPTKALCSEKFRDWNHRLKEMNCKVLEMTGDSKISTPEEAKAARLVIATPEKWDFITRRAGKSDPLMSKLKLFLVDEVHSVREKVRGALLEVLIARTKSRDPDTRIIAVSATIPNADDVAQWIGSRQRSPRDKPETRKLTPFVFSEDFRPCPLQKEIYGFKAKSLNESYYDFERELTKELPTIIEDYSKGKATLIFCSSRSGTQQVANALSEYCQKRIEQNSNTPWPTVRETNCLSFSNEELQNLSRDGIAFHHAGLDITDKRKVESAFVDGKIKILCATTTLAVGVNLPAYLVIIRGTKLNTGVFEEHSDLTILQMMGRAGRPQFDKEGVCVIMTEQDRREHYVQLLKGENIIESTLHLSLGEHINAEVCARGRCRAYNIEKWLKETFLFTRMSKNWEHYNIKGCSDRLSPEENVRNITRENLEALSEVDLIENYDSSKPDQEFNSTEYGRTMSNYSLRMRTMIELMNLQQGATMQSLISTISQANEFSDLFIRAGEKVMYNNVLRDLKLRFPPTRVESLHEKISVLLQLALTGFKIKEIMEKESKIFSANANNEQLQILKTAPKIARAMMNIAIYRKDGAFLNDAYMLSRSLNGKSWDDEGATLTQLDGLGSGTMQLLSQHNFKSIRALAKASPAELALMICRTTTQASRLINDAKKIPQIDFEAREVDVQPK